MKIYKTTILALGLIAGSAISSNAHCGACETDDMETSKNHSHQENSANADIQALVPDYLAVQEALAADDLPTTKASADALITAIGNSSELKKAKEAVVNISTAGTIAAAREAFLVLSNEMIANSEGLNLGNDKELYVAYCPMAFNNTGAHWLQKDKKINNPYWGAQMLRCGMIKKQIGLDD